MSTEKIPLVSVVIPMYNSAKFIPQTLESLLYQTLKDFEVIIVDDCSTDNSVEVVESYARKFSAEGINLNLVELPKNTATPGLPRNIGVQVACGKYIAFLDSDDFFTQTALEELTTLAEEFQADVVHTDTFFMLFDDDDLVVCNRQKLPVIAVPTFETTDLAQRIVNWIKRGYNWESVTMFCKRLFLVGNQIQFPRLLNNEDMVFSFAILCSAEKFLRVPNVTYIYRQREDSVSQRKYTEASDYFHKWLRVMNDGSNEFAKVMDSFSFFAENPDYRYAVLDFFFKVMSDVLSPFYSRFQEFTFNDLVKKEFHPDNAEFAAQLFNNFNLQRLEIKQLRRELEKFQRQ
ncbi:MAG: glycosyltransferase [Selenomonadaceae bacterium]|nr:glycosyltransferase [Selenomonadaceae bacterium]